jgi:hypothetical protein
MCIAFASICRVPYSLITEFYNNHLDAAKMKSAINNFSVSPKATFSGLCLLMLLGAALALSGCKSYGPVGAPDFDPTYSLTLEKNEQLLFSSWTEFVDGTYMEGEEEPRTSYIGVILLTDKRMMFAQWNENQHRYEPLIWTGYPYIAQVKMHNNILLQYIAIVATDGSKFTYMLDKQSVDTAYEILMEKIRQHPQIPLPEI